jgi:integrase
MPFLEKGMDNMANKKRKDGRYAKQVTVGYKNGKPIRKTVYGKTQKELDKKYRELMLLVDKGILLDDFGITISELTKQWYRIKKEGKIKRNTECCYSSLMKRINSAVGTLRVKDVTRYTIETLLADIQKEGLYNTSERILSMLYSIFEFAVDNDIIAKNPCKGLSVKYELKKKRVLTPSEKDNIDNATGLTYKESAFLLLLRYTGMRRGEVFALEKSDIDKQNMVIHITKTLIDNNGKPYIQHSAKTDAGKRFVPILLPLSKVLFKYIDSLERDYLFINKKGKLYAVNSMYFLFNNIKEKVGLGEDLTMHCFRHNFISECYKAKVDVKKLQKWVGHTDISTTLNIYTSLEKEDIESANELNEYYNSQNTVKPQNTDKKIS